MSTTDTQDTTAKLAYLIELDGQGDVVFALVDQETWDWINRDDSAERAGASFGSWDELHLAPETLRAALVKQNEAARPPFREDPLRLGVTTGSAENDRMLALCEGGCLYYTRDDVEDEVRTWAAENGYAIAEHHQGYIY